MIRYITLGLFILLVSSFSLQAQFFFPPLSPKANITQMVGNTIVKVEYSRPIARGRDIFGGLVPYGKVWQTSGGEGATIRFDTPVTIEDQELPAGIYALITIPGKKEWTIIIHDGNHGSFEYEKSKLIAQACVPVKKASRFHEALSIDLDPTPNDAQLNITWTDVTVSIPIRTNIDQKITAHIDSLISAPLASEGDPYFRSINYLLFNKLNPEKALALIARFQEIDKGEYPYRMRIRAHMQLGQKDEALEAVDQGIEVMKQEYADRPDRVESLLASYEKRRAKILSGTTDGQRAW